MLLAASAAALQLTVAAGRPLNVVVDQRIRIKDVGQPITGVVIQPVYVFDRIVVPAGAKVRGHVAAIEPLSKVARVRAILSGDLTPAHQVVLQFDTIVLPSGDVVSMQSEVKNEILRPTRTSAPPAPDAEQTGGVRRLQREATDRAKTAITDAKQRGHDLLDEIRGPGKTERVKEEIVKRLPYHPQVIAAGTGYHTELTAPLDFGAATAAAELAEPGVRPQPSSVLSARLITALDSSKTPRGTKVRAAVTEPVFSDDHRLVVPEGTILEGEVTLARPARRLHRNGQLRFLFESIQRDPSDTAPLLASLQSVEASGDDHVTVDEEGGTTLSDSKTRFIAPALAVLALRGSLDEHSHLDPDGDGHIIHSSHPGALGAGGFFGLGVLGAGLSQIWRPVGVGLTIVGAARTLYTNVLGRGRDVQFPADTPMQLQLAPGPAAVP